MGWLVEHWLAAVLLIAYTGALFYNAYVGRQASDGVAGYMVGNRKMSGWVIGISFYATFASTNSYIGHAGKGYEFGLIWTFMAVTLVGFTYVSWRWVGPKLRAFAEQFDALTIPDFLGSRFAKEEDHPAHLVRLFSALVIVFASLLYLIAIFKGAGHLFQMFFGISYEAAVGITLLIVMLYTSVGGFVSVVRTDVIQGLLMVVGAAVIFFFVTQSAGGVGALGQLAEMPEKQFLFELNAGIPFAILVGISLSGALKLLVDPRQLSRFYALKDEREAKRGIWIALFGLLLIQACLFPVGVYSHLILDSVVDTDLIVPTLVADPEVFPIWAGDFLIVAIVAAAMSSLDSVLLVAASTTYKNLLEPFYRSTSAVNWTRAMVVAFAVVAALLALNPPGDIVEITIFSGSLYAVCFLPAVLYGLHSERGRAREVLISMACGVSVLLLWFSSDYRAQLHEVFPGLIAAFAAFLLALKWSGKRGEA